jgi:hypothetical protein
MRLQPAALRTKEPCAAQRYSGKAFNLSSPTAGASSPHGISDYLRPLTTARPARSSRPPNTTSRHPRTAAALCTARSRIRLATLRKRASNARYALALRDTDWRRATSGLRYSATPIKSWTALRRWNPIASDGPLHSDAILDPLLRRSHWTFRPDCISVLCWDLDAGGCSSPCVSPVCEQLDLRDELRRQDEAETRALADLHARLATLHTRWDRLERLALLCAPTPLSPHPRPPSSGSMRPASSPSTPPHSERAVP